MTISSIKILLLSMVEVDLIFSNRFVNNLPNKNHFKYNKNNNKIFRQTTKYFIFLILTVLKQTNKIKS